MVETAPAGLGLERTRGPASGALANYGIQCRNDGAWSACKSWAHDASLGRRRPLAWRLSLTRTTSLVTGARSLLQLQGMVSRPFTLCHARRPGITPAGCLHRNPPRWSSPAKTRGIALQELASGGAIHGVQYDPVVCIVVGLQQRFAQLDDESRLVAMTQRLAFQRGTGTGIN